MTVRYWPLDEYDCTPQSRAIEVKTPPNVVEHFHFGSHMEAGRMFLSLRSQRGARHERDDRYHCVRGPGGLVSAVVP